METNRIRYVDIDSSSYYQNYDTVIQGGIVLRAPKGNAEPFYFPVGSENLMKQLFLKDNNPLYKDVLEAIEFNKSYSIYVSAPPGVLLGRENYFGGIYITTEGSIETFYKVTNVENPNFLASLRVGNTSSVFSNGSSILPYSLQTITAENIKSSYFEENKVNKILFTYTDEFGVKQEIVCKLNNGNIVTDDSNAFVVGTYAPGAGDTTTLTFVGNSSIPNFDLTSDGALDTYFSTPTGYATINIYWIYNIEEYVIQTIYQISPTEIPMTITIKNIDLQQTTTDGETNPYYNTLTFNFEENGYTSPDYIISLDPLAKDGFNASLYYENVFPQTIKYYLGTKPYKQYTNITGTYTIPISKQISGTRIISNNSLTDTQIEESLLEGWDAFNKTDFEDVLLFMDCTGYNNVINKMKSLRLGLFKTSTFITVIKPNSSDTVTAGNEAITKRATLPNTRGGLAYYLNEFEIKLGNNYVWSNLIGSIGVKLASIMDYKLGGRAPMYLDDGEGFGGQLYRSVRRAKYNFEAYLSLLDNLDVAGINPITKDKRYGIIIRSQRTAQSPTVLTDWSFLGHSMAFDLLKKEIKENVLIPQLGKPINSYYLDLRQSQTETIVKKRLTGATAIWDSAVVLVNDPNVNNDETKKQNKFVVKVRVKVNPYTEYIDLVLENVDQTTVL